MADIKHTHSILYTNLSNISLYYLFKSILIHQHLPFGSHKHEITKLLTKSEYTRIGRPGEYEVLCERGHV